MFTDCVLVRVLCVCVCVCVCVEEREIERESVCVRALVRECVIKRERDDRQTKIARSSYIWLQLVSVCVCV
jgi:hypothetical protein